jgi:hypothetical protein
VAASSKGHHSQRRVQATSKAQDCPTCGKLILEEIYLLLSAFGSGG